MNFDSTKSSQVGAGNNEKFYERELIQKLKKWADRKEIFAIKGPRQSGKTTLLRMFKDWLIEDKGVEQDHIIFSTFEDLTVRDNFERDPRQFIESYLIDDDRHYFLLDEFHYVEQGGKKLKLLYDTLENAKFVITGSSSLELKSQTSKYLVGRLFSFNLYPFSFWEFLNVRDKRLRKVYADRYEQVKDFIGQGGEIKREEDLFFQELNQHLSDYLRYGSYPEVIKAEDEETKQTILKNIFNTYITRDIIELLEVHQASKLRKLVTVLSSQLGGMANYNQLSDTCETYYKKVKKFMEILKETYVLEVIRPYHQNVKTELRKNPKVYFVDLGLRNYALDNYAQLENRNDRGEIVENFILNQLKRQELGSVHYWRTQGKAEVDFVVAKGDQLIPIEVKFRKMGSPKIPSGLKSFISSYDPDRAVVASKDLWGDKQYKQTQVKFVPAVYF